VLIPQSAHTTHKVKRRDREKWAKEKVIQHILKNCRSSNLVITATPVALIRKNVINALSKAYQDSVCLDFYQVAYGKYMHLWRGNMYLVSLVLQVAQSINLCEWL
jgi:hypothetical protein